MILFGAQAVVASLLAASLFLAYRWLSARAAMAAKLYAVGLLLRVVAGLAFAATWQLPAHSGRFDADTRWFLDAQSYFAMARAATANGLAVVDDTGPSPSFVRFLALWMSATGDSHAAVMLLSLLTYMGICVVAVAVLSSRNDAVGRRAAALVVGSFALSPNLILLATQPLKDTMFFGALTLVVVASWHMLSDRPRQVVGLSPLALAVTLLGTYVMAGMRVYYGLLILGLMGLVLGLRWLQVTVAERRWLARETAAGALFLATIWVGCWWGGGVYYTSLVDPVTQGTISRLRATASELTGWGTPPPALSPIKLLPSVARGVVDVVERSRAGFEASGGATNMAPPELDRTSRVGTASRLRGLALGLAAVFVPVTLLRTTGVITFEGGGRAILLTDLDTLFLDLAIGACLFVTWRNRALLRGRWTSATFVLLLGVTSALLVGYVVTNYGTLFRLRLMAAVPLWLLPLCLAESTPSLPVSSKHAG